LHWRPGLTVHVPLRVGGIVSQLGVLGIERQPGTVRLGEMSHKRPVGFQYRVVDWSEFAIVGQKICTRSGLDRHTDIFPYFYANCSISERLTDTRNCALSEIWVFKGAGIKGRRPRQGPTAIAGHHLGGAELFVEIERLITACRADHDVQSTPIR